MRLDLGVVVKIVFLQLNAPSKVIFTYHVSRKLLNNYLHYKGSTVYFKAGDFVLKAMRTSYQNLF